MATAAASTSCSDRHSGGATPGDAIGRKANTVAMVMIRFRCFGFGASGSVETLEHAGKLREGLGAQLDQCFANIDAALAGAGMDKANLVKITVYLTVPGADAAMLYRQRLDVWIGSAGHVPAATLQFVSQIASPVFLCEVEAVAAGA